MSTRSERLRRPHSPILAVVVGVTLTLAVLAVVVNARNGVGGFDFKGSVWAAGSDVLAGRNPYPAADPSQLLIHGNSYVYPPVLAVLAAPLSMLPEPVAFVVWTLVNALCVLLALHLVGVKDRRLLAFALVTFPVVDALILGQPDGLLALLLALGWRYRNSNQYVSGAGFGLLIGAKLLAWPVLVWLLLTRRWRAAATTGASALASIFGSWAVIGFRGLGDYSRLLAADATAFENHSHSLVAFVLRLGGDVELGRAAAGVVALALLIASLHAVRRSADELLSLALALLAGLAVSPIVHSHYLGLLLIPLAIRYPHFGRPWLVLTALWLSPTEGRVAHTWQLLVPWVVALALVAAIRARPRLDPSAAPFMVRARAPLRVRGRLESTL
jgi:hypothetical protein